MFLSQNNVCESSNCCGSESASRPIHSLHTSDRSPPTFPGNKSFCTDKPCYGSAVSGSAGSGAFGFGPSIYILSGDQSSAAHRLDRRICYHSALNYCTSECAALGIVNTTGGKHYRPSLRYPHRPHNSAH